MAPLAAKGPVLVHFFDFSQLNSVRTLPYIEQWHRRYAEHGLRVIGVQAPRMPFGSDPETVGRGLERLGITFPVVVDDARVLWSSYGCEGWPSLFLWGRGGKLRWFHFGEGDYRSTEEAIHQALAGPGGGPELPEPMNALRPTDVEGAMVVPPGAELMPAGDRPWTIGEDGEFLEVQYDGGGIHATVAGEGSLDLVLDGRPVDAVEIAGPGLYDLAEHDRHGTHHIGITLKGAPELWSLSFSPAVAEMP